MTCSTLCEAVYAARPILIEADHPGFASILLCEGKDSLNLSLLPWKNPVIVASASPIYNLVKAFTTDNDLSFDVISLDYNSDIFIECEM
jgi:hypothetical protein